MNKGIFLNTCLAIFCLSMLGCSNTTTRGANQQLHAPAPSAQAATTGGTLISPL